MSVLQAIVLGVLQGITEFLPISSSGHLILLPQFFGWQDQGLFFDAWLHLATGIAILFALRKEVFLILKDFFNFLSGGKNREKITRQSWFYILIAIIPAGVVGYLADDFIGVNFRSAKLVAFGLIFWGSILFLSEKISKQKISKLENIGSKRSLFVGFLQVIALVPGTSRSGITITAGLFSGLKKETAVNFSFLVGVPLVVLAGIKKMFDYLSMGSLSVDWLIFLVGFFSAFFSGILAIRLLQWIARNKSFVFFVIYRILLGVLILLIV